MGGDSNPRCLSAHTLSRRAQSTALSPIPAIFLFLSILILFRILILAWPETIRTD